MTASNAANTRPPAREHVAGGPYRVVLVAAPDRRKRPPIVRLRLALKVLRRAFALRCVEVAEEGAER